MATIAPVPLAVGDERLVHIGPVAHGGHFIAHADGRTLLVRHALPGERVRVRITAVSRKIVRADAIEILEPAEDRVAPPCRWSGPGGCGGCDFQHVSIEAQRRLKQQVLVEALTRFGGMDPDDAGLETVVRALPGSPDGLHWRTRMRWATGADGSMGLRRHRSHDVVAVDRCLIAVAGSDVPAGASAPGRVVHELRGRAWRLASDDFWQVHAQLPETLVATVLEFGGPATGQRWWDLYSGAGLFAAFLGEAVGEGGRVDAVEAAPEGTRAARRALHDLPQVALQTAEVAAWLNDVNAHGRPHGVVLDPPRSGAGRGVVEAIAAVGPSVIVYVACDPVALSRDVALLAGAGYRLTAIRAFDAFPMTHHFETVARLERAQSP